MKTVHREIVAVIISSKDEKLFLAKMHPQKTGVYLDSWHIPGGGADAGETLEEALIREIKEELGFDLSPYKIELYDDLGYGESQKLYNGEKVIAKMHFNVYKVVVTDKKASEIKIALCEDLDQFAWISPKEMSKYKLTPPSVELFSRKPYFKDYDGN